MNCPFIQSCKTRGRRPEGGSVGTVITSDKHVVVFNYQVFTLLPLVSISQAPKNRTHTVAPRY